MSIKRPGTNLMKIFYLKGKKKVIEYLAMYPVLSFFVISLCDAQAYTSKRRILIQVLPATNAYTKSANACIYFAKSFCCLLMHRSNGSAVRALTDRRTDGRTLPSTLSPSLRGR